MSIAATAQRPSVVDLFGSRSRGRFLLYCLESFPRT